MFEWFLIFILLLITLLLFVKYVRLMGRVEERAREVFEEWKEKELEKLRMEYWKRAMDEARLRLERWRQAEEERIRRDAIERSMATILGKVGEQLAPLIIFSNYGISPKDIRFLGSPIDFIAFKGLSEGKPEKIIFIEVKSGKSPTLTERERMIKKLVEQKKVEWLLVHMPTEVEKLLNSIKTEK